MSTFKQKIKSSLPYVAAMAFVFALWMTGIRYNARATNMADLRQPPPDIALNDPLQPAIRIDMQEGKFGVQLRAVDTQYGIYCMTVNAAEIPLSCVQILDVDMHAPMRFEWEAQRLSK